MTTLRRDEPGSGSAALDRLAALRAALLGTPPGGRSARPRVVPDGP